MTKTQTIKQTSWGWLEPGDIVIGLNYAVVESITHESRYGYPSDGPTYMGKSTVTFKDGRIETRLSGVDGYNIYRNA